MTPETRYARSGDVNIAYQVVGEGGGRPGLRAGMGLERRADVGGAGDGALPRSPRILLPLHSVRQAWDWALRPDVERQVADSRGQDGRRTGSARGGRVGAGRASRALRGRKHVRSVRRHLSGEDVRLDHARLLREAARSRRGVPVGAYGREPGGVGNRRRAELGAPAVGGRRVLTRPAAAATSGSCETSSSISAAAQAPVQLPLCCA